MAQFEPPPTGGLVVPGGGEVFQARDLPVTLPDGRTIVLKLPAPVRREEVPADVTAQLLWLVVQETRAMKQLLQELIVRLGPAPAQGIAPRPAMSRPPGITTMAPPGTPGPRAPVGPNGSPVPPGPPLDRAGRRRQALASSGRTQPFPSRGAPAPVPDGKEATG